MIPPTPPLDAYLFQPSTSSNEPIPVRLDEATSAAEDYQKGLKGEEQWVSEVLDFSSSYSGALTGSYGPIHVVGPCSVFPQLRSSGTCWCPQTASGSQFITVAFEQPVIAKAIHIYETSHPGSVVRIRCKKYKEGEEGIKPSKVSKLVTTVSNAITGNSSAPHLNYNSDDWVTVFERSAPAYTNGKAEDFCPPLKFKNIKTRIIRVDMVLAGWSEIDAIKLVGKPKIEYFESQLTALSAVYKKMFKDALFTDILLIHTKSGKQIKAHKSILTRRSEFFKAMVECDMIESKTSVIEFDEDISYEIFESVIEYVYTNHIEVNMDNIFHVYVLADKLLIHSLCTYCGRMFSTFINDDNVFKLSQIAKQFRSYKLNEIAMEWIVDSYTELFMTKEFAELDKDDLLVVCKRLAEKHSGYESTTKVSLPSLPPQPRCAEPWQDEESEC
ncbi:hypothetical protein C9374_014665 [Naegleria lovaniensis]|uniref:BTB domain-containing protein n=1 Tax=Naegleria lovaniensis TaxID=51637 RepID=A0AA88GYA0_NAELO|nr:uncharacterized protein C9374_014665 [Naegleria lovaniensis]KAG2389265.1 hypothetical protein C9374_014665 [Naegleria lovaniensis]